MLTSESLSYQIGLDGFVWFMGVVESLDDTLKIGRAKVRVIGFHDADIDKLSTNELPWAYPLLPVSQAQSVPNYRPGDWVVGFFLDGKLGQQPMIAWVLPSLAQK